MMSLNVDKCGVVVYRPEEGVSCNVSGTTLQTLQQYTYLGVPMTVDLDLNVIMQDRKRRAPIFYHAMRPFLTRRQISAVIRVQMVRSVLVPIAIYGCGLYEMSSTQLVPTQRVIYHAIRDIMGFSSNCYQKAA